MECVNRHVTAAWTSAYMLSQRPRPLTHGTHAGRARVRTGARVRARARTRARVRARARARARARPRPLTRDDS